jgi:hypothetical protein
MSSDIKGLNLFLFQKVLFDKIDTKIVANNENLLEIEQENKTLGYSINKTIETYIKKNKLNPNKFLNSVDKIYVIAHSSDYEFSSQSHFEVNLSKVRHKLDVYNSKTVIVMYKTPDVNFNIISKIIGNLNTNLDTFDTNNTDPILLENEKGKIIDDFVKALEEFFKPFDGVERDKALSNLFNNPSGENATKCLEMYV